MTQYVFARGKLHEIDGINLKPGTRRHPVQTGVLFIICNASSDGHGANEEVIEEDIIGGEQDSTNQIIK